MRQVVLLTSACSLLHSLTSTRTCSEPHVLLSSALQVLVDHKLQSEALKRQLEQLAKEKDVAESKRTDIQRSVAEVHAPTQREPRMLACAV